MQNKIILDMLTQDSVSIKQQNYTIINGVEYLIGEPWRKSYINSTKGRQEVQKELEEKYVKAIFSVWGDTPSVDDNTSQ